jgi:hypothetical protein
MHVHIHIYWAHILACSESLDLECRPDCHPAADAAALAAPTDDAGAAAAAVDAPTDDPAADAAAVAAPTDDAGAAAAADAAAAAYAATADAHTAGCSRVLYRFAAAARSRIDAAVSLIAWRAAAAAAAAALSRYTRRWWCCSINRRRRTRKRRRRKSGSSRLHRGRRYLLTAWERSKAGKAVVQYSQKQGKMVEILSRLLFWPYHGW